MFSRPSLPKAGVVPPQKKNKEGRREDLDTRKIVFYCSSRFVTDFFFSFELEEDTNWFLPL